MVAGEIGVWNLANECRKGSLYQPPRYRPTGAQRHARFRPETHLLWHPPAPLLQGEGTPVARQPIEIRAVETGDRGLRRNFKWSTAATQQSHDGVAQRAPET